MADEELKINKHVTQNYDENKTLRKFNRAATNNVIHDIATERANHPLITGESVVDTLKSMKESNHRPKLIR